MTKYWFPILILSTLAFAAVDAATPDVLAGPALVAIPRSAADDGPLFNREGLTLLQELNGHYLAAGEAEALARLGQEGRSFTVLATLDDHRDFFLLRCRKAADEAALRQVGDLLAVEGVTRVLSVPAGTDLRGLIPTAVRYRPLPFRPIRPQVPVARLAETKSATHPSIPGMIGRVSTTLLTDDVQSLQDFGTRDATDPKCNQAGDLLYQTLTGYGYQPSIDNFEFNKYSAYAVKNVVAVLPGRSHPGKQVIVCGHYDSINNSGVTAPAPGADDNGSGTAAVLEAARVMSRYTFDYTVVFICFSAEEYGLYGSAHYAAAAHQAGADIVAVYNLDMVAYNHSTPYNVYLFCNQASSSLADFAIAAAEEYVPALHWWKTVDPNEVYSDHASFWEQGYPALFAIETDENPNYHHSSDTLSTMNMDYFTNIVKASVAGAALSAGPLSLKGDYNGDWLLNATDVGLLAAHLAASGDLGEAADYNGDGVQNVLDLCALQRDALD